MNKNLIKKLARRTVSGEYIDQKVVNFALSNFSRKELIEYATSLRKAIYKNSVRVISSEELSPNAQESIRSKFKDRVVFFEQDQSQSAGIKVIINDTVMDLSVDGYIKQTLEQLKT